MNRMRKYGTILLSAMLFAGCVTATNDLGDDSQAPIYPGTRLSDGTPVISDDSDIAQQDITGIQILRVDGDTYDFAALPEPTISGSVKAKSTVMSISPVQYYKAERDDVRFVAYYPRHSSYTPGGGATPAVASFNITGQQDILISDGPVKAEYGSGKPGFTADNPAPFYFRHQMAMIVLRVLAKDQGTVDTYGENVTASLLNVPDQMEIRINADGTTSFGMKASSTTATIAFPAFKMAVESSDPGFTPPTSTVLVHPSTNVDKIRLAFAGRAAEDYDVWTDDGGGGQTRLSLEAGKSYVVTARVTAYAILFEVQVSSWIDKDREYINVGS